jgi:hypothetical protein
MQTYTWSTSPPHPKWRDSHQQATWGFTITLRHTTLGWTPLDEWSARRINLYLTTHNTHNRQTDMLPARFEPIFSAGERPQIYAVDRATTGIVLAYILLQILEIQFYFHTAFNFIQPQQIHYREINEYRNKLTVSVVMYIVSTFL